MTDRFHDRVLRWRSRLHRDGLTPSRMLIGRELLPRLYRQEHFVHGDGADGALGRLYGFQVFVTDEPGLFCEGTR